VSHRLLFVTGKGGVGKSTVSAALALACAKAGRRTLLAETSGQARLQRAFGCEGGPSEEVELAPRLFAVSIDPDVAMGEYLGIRMGALGRAIGSTKLFQGLTTATPGMREMQTMAKIWELAHPERPAGRGLAYDVVVVDAPSSGYAVGWLQTPRTFAELARVGPVANGARLIAAMIADPAFTGFVAVTTADLTAVTATFSLRDALAADGLSLSAVVLNRLSPDRFTREEAEELERSEPGAPDAVASAVRTAVLEHQRASSEAAQAARLEADAAVPLVALPLLSVDRLGKGALRTLASALAEAWPANVAAAPS
jgi:anion-transporting  ArsA/GET3 family ATPase